MYPESRCSLEHENPFQLVIATVLSAQCTDARVNQVTPSLFARYPTPAALAGAGLDDVEETIRSVNFFRNKSKALIGLGAVLTDEHGGEVPDDLEALTRLPGVGRKTANVVMGVGFGHAEGVVVDTHVKRVAARLHLTRHEDPVRVEVDLLKLLPVEERVIFTHRVIDHGRAVCVARTPRCGGCALWDLCPTGQKLLPGGAGDGGEDKRS
ncbi:endonuclease III [soil metagenome]